jgi:phosphoribosyl-dephospho-CoA transferase
MTLYGPAPAHDLIRLRHLTALTVDAPMPAWVQPALKRAPWVVVRRGYFRDGMIPVGVRGVARHERFAAWLSEAEIADRLSPEDLTDSSYAIERARSRAVRALAALARVAPVLDRRGLRWGPGGSVGFEIATGAPTATSLSDLDLIVRQYRRFEPGAAADLLANLAAAAAPARIDVMIETPQGGVSLDELAAMPQQMLMRTPHGARLMVDPWLARAVSC